MFAGICLSDPYADDRRAFGSATRTLSATHFAGRYRLVDFTLSNMVNSKIYTIGIVLNSHYQSLISHIGMGKEWNLARKLGGVTFFPPYLTDERRIVNDELDGPLSRAAEFIAGTNADYVVLADSSIAYNMDYRSAIEAHFSSGADVTAIYAKKTPMDEERQHSVSFLIDKDNCVRDIFLASSITGESRISLGAYIMHKKYFLQLTSGESNCGILKFSTVLLARALDRLKVNAFEFVGYSAQICSLGTYFNYNMEMLDNEKRNALFDYENRRIFTSRRDSLPTKYGKEADVTNSIIAEGCRIDGTVKNSVICRNVVINEGAIVKNCILHDAVTVEKNAELDWVIADNDVIITANRSMIGYSTYPVYIQSLRII